MSGTEKRYAEAGMLPPKHDTRVSPELHVVHPELQPPTPTVVAVEPARASAPRSTTKRKAPAKRAAARTTTTAAQKPAADTKEASA